MDSSSSQQSSHEIIIEEEEEDDLDFLSSSDEVSSNNSMEDSTSSASSSASSDQLASGPLHEISSIMQQLHFKRGLSKHYQGKSQSFTSLTNVRCLEDLVKPENPYRKKLKSCKSYGGLSEGNKSYPPNTCSRTISKKALRGSCSSLNGKRNSRFLGNRPPSTPQHRTSSLPNQTPLFV
ncbi:hypothetical protein HHK36_030222 [Tetracentron sinense]|uniref:Oxidative stress 3 n=1 Tax=Tetracentron sinense TaxID=13715 RepID=A0A834YC84_TETSI|nr:hypothetical protein HHK36_030222 [Tetracentron sinense]